MQEIAAMEELAGFAAAYLPAKQLNIWRRKMKGYLFSIYLDMQTTAKQKRIAFKQVLLNFSFEKMHFRQLVKLILGAVGKKK